MTLLNDTDLGLAKRLRAARLLADMEQAEIAERIGVARTTVSAWERGLTEPSATHFVRWAKETSQPLEWLAEGIRVEVHPPGLEPGTHWLRVCGRSQACADGDHNDCLGACSCWCHDDEGGFVTYGTPRALPAAAAYRAALLLVRFMLAGVRS